jgi:hypothetical protein
MINRIKRPALRLYRPIWHILGATTLGALIAMLAAAFVLFVPLAPEVWEPLSVAERVKEARSLSGALFWNALVDATHASWIAHLRMSDPIGYPDFDELHSAIAQRWTIAVEAGLAFAVPFARAMWLLIPLRQDARHVQGPRLVQGPWAARRARKAMAGALRQGHTIDLAPQIPLPREREIRSFMLVGGQRSGKTVVFRSWMRQLIGTRAKLVVHDTKGDMTQDWPTDDVILLAPHDARSWGWDIGRDIVGELRAFEFAAALVPEPDKDPQWAMGAQHILTAVLIALQRRHGTAWGWSELCAALQQSPDKLYQMAVDHHPMAAQFLAMEGGEYTRTSAGYVTTLMGPAARLIQPLAAAWGDLHPDFRLSLKDWIADDYEGPRTIILQRMPDFPEMSRLWLSAVVNHMIGIAGGSNLPDDPTRRIWMCLDEFPQIGKIRSLFDVPATHAAKGVTLALAFQTLGQVRDVYGPNAMGNLGQLTGTKVVFRSQGEDAEYVADKITGKWRFTAPEWTSKPLDNSWLGNDTVSWRTHEQNLVLSASLGDLTPNTTGAEGLVLGLDGGDIYRLSWPYEHWPKQRKGTVEAAWVSQIPPPPPAVQAKARPVRTRTT